ncbi:precorrin-8X methylmutase [uncultured Desulfuromonas sp.]|uniref:precorrin-8X methylmutase n=1 Tax=uncultured Desulfuromonas sp. TaxID=181013 RepID=UPI002AAC1589|nr:precorrin-8X methylmutase [uncultured Desulfuromonas sp.]
MTSTQNPTPPTRPLIYDLYDQPVSGAEIERRSFAAIDAEADRSGFTNAQWQVVRRLIHTTADFSLAEHIRFSDDAFSSCAAALLRGATIYADSNMIRSGLSVARLQQIHPGYQRDSILCHVADADVAEQAKESGLPRSLFAVRKAANQLDGSIILIGNAPVALLEINRLILEQGLRPALVIGMPVGFVHVLESKEELQTTGVPYIVIEGRRGGSPLAVACLHALCGLVGID